MAGAVGPIESTAMTDPEDFLTRWSRRKREAKSEAKSEVKSEVKAAPETDADKQDSNQVVATDAKLRDVQQTNAETVKPKAENTFDLSKLPSLDSIGPATDIRVFLQPGVPEALSRAALRRAWSADPAIRDFIGLSENSWDFTAADGMHGFGALDPADAKRLITQLLGGDNDKDAQAVLVNSDAEHGSGDPEPETRAVTEAIPAESSDDAAPEPEHEAMADCSGVAKSIGGQAVSNSASEGNVAMQNEPEEIVRQARRIHGRALPQ